MSGAFEDLNNEMYAKTVKASQSSFALLKYDEKSDSSVVLCRPETVSVMEDGCMRMHISFFSWKAQCVH